MVDLSVLADAGPLAVSPEAETSRIEPQERGSENASKPRIPGLHRIAAAVELAQIGQPADRQPVRVLLARLEQRPDILRHLGARVFARSRGAVQQQVIGLHDAVDRDFHKGLRCEDQLMRVSASNWAIALLASLMLLDSPC